jgi:hypothetical protein
VYDGSGSKGGGDGILHGQSPRKLVFFGMVRPLDDLDDMLEACTKETGFLWKCGGLLENLENKKECLP